MRILGGNFKGKNLYGSQDLSIRPLTNRAKKSIFDSLQNFYRDKSVLDLFSGSGSFGLEALSRGAKSVTFIEKCAKSLAVLRRNLSHFSINSAGMEIIQADALKFCLQTHQSYDLILMDPPFNFPDMQTLIHSIFRHKVLKEKGIMVVHHEISNPIQPDAAEYTITKQKKIGRSLISYIVWQRSYV
jgi:16S rRNA (guanine966-N2)-methyltransferase